MQENASTLELLEADQRDELLPWLKPLEVLKAAIARALDDVLLQVRLGRMPDR
jgi:hypothetical protein